MSEDDWADFASIRPSQPTAAAQQQQQATNAPADSSSGGDFWAADFVSATNSSAQAPNVTTDSFGEDWGSFDNASHAVRTSIAVFSLVLFD